MDLHVAHFTALSVASHIAKGGERERTSDTVNTDSMPDNKGWRKIGHSKQPKKPSKAPPPPKTISDSPSAPEDLGDRRRQSSWLKPRQSSRPQTPVNGVPTTPAAEDTEDVPSERSESSAARRDSKPKLARYTSLFTTFKDTSKGPEFAEPWSEDAPPPFQPYVDPLDVVQSVRSHMMNASQPIPVEQNSGLFRVFEDYRKMREQKETLSALLEDTLQAWDKAEKHWHDCETRYDMEIRRLELLIARGTSGMTGLMKARQGSVVDRRGRHKKTISHDSFPPMYDFRQLDTEIKLRSQRVFPHRPVSPSEKMIALSKHFEGTNTDLPVGTPQEGMPGTKKNVTLSRQVQSELNLVNLGNSRASAFSGRSGDSLPDETTAFSQARMGPGVACDALIALRELGTLVARRRGLNVDSFNNGLMMLFSKTSTENAFFDSGEEEDVQPPLPEKSPSARKPYFEKGAMPRRALLRFQSQPDLSTQHKHRRQFSFEPGADKLQALLVEYKSHGAEIRDSGYDESDTSPSLRAQRPTLGSQSLVSSSSSVALNTDFSKASKIPSPVQTLGRVRRETSASSVQSLYTRPLDDRRDSRASVLTAFRENSSGNLRPVPQSRSSSNNNLRTADASIPTKDAQSGPQSRNNSMALAAARVAGKGSRNSLPEDGSPSKTITKASSFRPFQLDGAVKLENHTPEERHQRVTGVSSSPTIEIS
ncbi:hypothetical protein BDW02DRAFT_2426 [Decorospora gaudefroyi]|uniref:Uncharacterized protein n=1 Tax=Decorospora gaudefroyi TaxID=184978 RepID=A0A6A5KW18_9PLEO|nr:hypothetical protein BDW02DRAFT_2426 [Decorospora gaudefroyi]